MTAPVPEELRAEVMSIYLRIEGLGAATGQRRRHVDDRIVLARLANPSDLADFVAAVADWTSTGR